ncbi:MAG: transcriptional regulator [Candidatus Cloacimonetes bacterium]|jgi:DNA-binding HxlR family transcriptional regulator|nr:transcriptional regulator [Candidatus Cloacimonadota bacterium]
MTGKTERLGQERKRKTAHSTKRRLHGVRGQSLTRSLELDRTIHERIRLGIVSALAVNESLTFNELKALLDTTDGNLSVHARKLEDASYITCTKTFDGRVPRTEYRLTESGRGALDEYIRHMEALIRSVRDPED